MEIKPFEQKVWLSSPTMHGEEIQYIKDAFDTNWISTVGANINESERLVAEKIGCKDAVGLSCGTAALHLAIKLAGERLYGQPRAGHGSLEGKKVFCTDMTFDATVNPVAYEGGEAVFIDTEYDTWNMDPKALEKAFEIFPEVKLVVLAHLYGTPGKVDELRAVCDKHGALIVEDAAESIGSLYKGKHTGTFGKVGALSFNGNKTITTGGGGMMLFNDEELGAFAKHITTQAKIPHRWEFRHDHIGYNYRMPNINAALGCAQLEHIEEYVASKRETAKAYEEFFKDIPDIEFFVEPKDTRSNYWLNVVILKDKEAQQSFLQYTNDNGVMTRPIWELMNRLPMFEKCENDGLKNTIWFADRVVNIPSSVKL